MKLGSPILKVKGLNARGIGLILAPVISILIIIFADLKPGHPEVTYTLAVAVLMAIWWITEAIPIAATALLPVALFPLLGVMNGKAVSSSYFNHLIFLFIGGFIIALAMEKWNLHKRIALRILMFVGVSPGRILLGFMLATAFLSMWISNTATAMMMVPIVLSIIQRLEEVLGESELKKYSMGVFFGVAYSASIGGIATLVGTPPNLSFARIFSILFPQAPEISFAKWFFFAFPVTLVMLVAAWVLLYFLYKPKNSWKNLSSATFKDQYKELGRISFEESCVFGIFIALAFLWIFRSGIKFDSFNIPGWSSLFSNPKFINDGTVAMAAALILFMIPSKNVTGTRILGWETIQKLPWHIVLLFGGGFALAGAFATSGLSLWFGEKLSWVADVHPIGIIFAITLLISLLTELTSNTATIEMLLPVIAGISMTTSINPLLFMVPATLAASLAFMLPVATPPNAIVFGTNRLRIVDMVKTGFVLNLVGILLVTLAMYFLGTYILGIDIDVFPEWAQASSLVK